MSPLSVSFDPWRVRLLAGVVLILLAAGVSLSAESSPWLAGATLLILGHVMIGVWVFVRRLMALSVLQQWMDLFAFLLMGGAVMTMPHLSSWAAFFAGAFAVAILKYRLCLEGDLSEGYQAYIREKIRLETPAVFLFALAAVIPNGVPFYRLVEIGLFAGALLFAVYLILIRRIYPPKE